MNAMPFVIRLAVFILLLGMPIRGQAPNLPVPLKRPAPKPAIPPPPPPPKLGTLFIVTNLSGAQVNLFASSTSSSKPFRTGVTDASESTTFTPLPPGTYRVQVQAPEHHPFQGTIKIQAGKVETLAAKLVPTFGFILLTAPKLDPLAQIELDGNRLTETQLGRESDQVLRIKTPPAKHLVRITQPRFLPFEQTVLVEAGAETPVPVKLELELATLTVTAEPGARVYLNEQASGVIPTTGQLRIAGLVPTETCQVRLELAEYEVFSQTIPVLAQKENLLRVKLHLLPTSGPFEDFFSGGLSLWQAPSGWKTKSEVLTVTGPPGVGLPKNLLYRDCEIGFTLKLNDLRGTAWLVHAKDEKNGYLFYLNGPTGRFPNQLRTYLMEDGKFNPAEPVTTPVPLLPPLNLADYYRVRIRIEGSEIRHWLKPGSTGEEIQVGYFKDLKNTFPSGNVGFVVLEGESYQVNGFRIVPVPMPNPK